MFDIKEWTDILTQAYPDHHFRGVESEIKVRHACHPVQVIGQLTPMPYTAQTYNHYTIRYVVDMHRNILMQRHLGLDGLHISSISHALNVRIRNTESCELHDKPFHLSTLFEISIEDPVSLLEEIRRDVHEYLEREANKVIDEILAD